MPLQLLALTAVGQSLSCSTGVQTLPAEPATIVHFTVEKGMGDWTVVSSGFLSSPV